MRTRTRRAANLLLDRLESSTSDGGERRLAQPPLLIVGAPRCGSTLVYQVLVQAFDVAYLSNRHCRLWGAPSLVERRRPAAPPAAYESRYGRTAGADAPSECEQFWYRFFRRRPQYVPLADADPKQLRRLRAALRALGRAAGKPLVFKNLLNALRLEPLGAALPEAVFVFVRRDTAETAASILAARREIRGDEASWWSAEPPETDELRGLPPAAQAVEQVRRIEALIEGGRDRLGGGRFCELRYERFCDDPEEALGEVAALAARNGVRLERRHAVPAKFERSGKSRLEPQTYDEIAEYARSR